MPFEVGQVVNGAAEWVCGSSIVYGVLRNPIITALLITALAMIIIFTVLNPGKTKNAPRWQTNLRCGIYLFLGISAIMFVHYYALGRSLRSDASQKGIRDVVNQVHFAQGGGYGATNYQVTPGSGNLQDEPATGGAGDQHGLRWREDSFRTETPKLVQEPCDCPLTAAQRSERTGAREEAVGTAPGNSTGRQDNVRADDLVLEEVIMPSAQTPFPVAEVSKGQAAD